MNTIKILKENKKDSTQRKEFDIPAPSTNSQNNNLADTRIGIIGLIISLLSAFNSKIITNKNIELRSNAKIAFNGKSTQYDIYRPQGDNTTLLIDARTDAGNESIQIGGVKKPLSAYVIGTDEGMLKADNNTNNSYLLVEPSRAGFFTNTTNTFKLRLPNLASTPATCSVGEITVAGAKLYICTASNTWTVVGTQT